MIVFERVEYKNILSTGKAGTTIDLRGGALSIIQGKNGSGKSTFMDAIHFALFGKPFRKIKIGQLANSLNKKNMMVNLSFSQSGNSYRVSRGIAPTIFEIYKNDELIPQPARSADYQQMMEDKILGFSSKTFGQVVVLGSSSYTPFMNLSTPDRRLVVEDLLDLRIFSAMNDNVKKRVSGKKDLMKDIQSQYNILDAEMEIREEHNAKISAMSDTSISEKNKELEMNQLVIDEINCKIVMAKSRVESLERIKSPVGEHRKRIAKIETYRINFHSKLTAISKEHKFYESHDDCPTCKQLISSDTKVSNVTHLNESRQRLERGITKTDVELADLNTSLVEMEQNIDDLQVAGGDLRLLGRELQSAIDTSTRLEDEISRLMNLKSAEITDLNELKSELLSVSEEKGKIFDHQLVLSDINSLLKDDGIKAIIINKYIPVLNALISKNLEILNFPCKFVFDKDFNEIIKSRGRDIFTYNSFSEGEKIRIDIALLFAFKELAQMKNSLNTNLLILDEADQGNLDSEGVAGFLNLIQTQEKSNIFIISHLPEVLASRVDTVFNFEKVGNFSKMNQQNA